MSNTLHINPQHINLLTLLPKLCNRGNVAVRPSKTGVRIFVQDATSTTSVNKIVLKANGEVDCRILDMNTDEESSIAWDIFEQEIAESHDTNSDLNAVTIAALCNMHNIAVRPSKTGVRLYLADKGSDTISSVARFLTDGSFNFETTAKIDFDNADALISHIVGIEADGH
jgi:hypothetical protein